MRNPFDSYAVLETEFDSEQQDCFLNFVDPAEDLPPEFVKAAVSDALEEFSFDEILQENGIEEDEVLEILFELGYIGLPEFIEYEEVEDREETAED